MKSRQTAMSENSRADRKPQNETPLRKAANRNMSLRSFFMLTVFGAFAVVVLLSGLVIWGCVAFRNYLLPNPNAAYLTIEYTMEDGTRTSTTNLLAFGEESEFPRIVTEAVESVTEEDSVTVKTQTKVTGSPNAARIETNEIMLDATYSIQKLESSYDTLTPRRKLAYQFCGAAMVIIPAVLSIAGILFCGFYFYRKRLVRPIELLSYATEEIAAQNLDFTLEYACGDEMGALCRSFETMRRELAENNKAMWNMLEQRRLMQASIAHDLRNPIAIIEGYTEYLQMNLPAGKIGPEKARRIAENLHQAAKRLEKYTESVRELNQLEDMELHREEVPVRKLAESIREDFEVMAAGAGKTLLMNCGETGGNPERTVKADIAVLHRILENLFENATRFAQNIISVDFVLSGCMLQITVTDDGEGFPDEILRKRKKAFLPTGQAGHLGMGLAVSRVLCEKHGGSLELGNAVPHGGMVKVNISVI